MTAFQFVHRYDFHFLHVLNRGFMLEVLCSLQSSLLNIYALPYAYYIFTMAIISGSVCFQLFSYWDFRQTYSCYFKAPYFPNELIDSQKLQWVFTTWSLSQSDKIGGDTLPLVVADFAMVFGSKVMSLMKELSQFCRSLGFRYNYEPVPTKNLSILSYTNYQNSSKQKIVIVYFFWEILNGIK